ncbi:MAG TPA: response regulator transcription factor [Candidatus Tectomicrobia bacterium]
MPPVQIVVAEDHAEFRELLSKQLGLEPDLKVIGEARDGFEAIAAVARLAPDVLTLDLDLPGLSGLEVLEVVRWCSPNTKVIILSGHDEEETVLEAIRLGARGYIVKAEGTNPVKAVRAVQRGEVWARRRVLARVLEELIGVADLTLPATGGEPAPA